MKTRLEIFFLSFLLIMSQFGIMVYADVQPQYILPPPEDCLSGCYPYYENVNKSVPFYSQTGSPYGSIVPTYIDPKTKEIKPCGSTLSLIGCFITSYAMVANYYNPNHNPVWTPKVLSEMNVVNSSCG